MTLFDRVTNQIVKKNATETIEVYTSNAIRLSAEDTNTALALGVQRLDGPEERPPYPILPQHLPQFLPGDPVIRLLPIPGHIDQL